MMMAAMGLPVPSGFVVPIGEDLHILDKDPKAISEILPDSIQEALNLLESKTGMRLGDPENPLFLSVRSGAAISMPGMMDTFLNIGLTLETCPALARRLGCSLDEAIELYQESQKNWNMIRSGGANDHDAKTHLWLTIQAVRSSWASSRAQAYRQHHHLKSDGGTAVIVQTMVFGNASGISGTGVLFTRRPDSGENAFFGEFLTHAQGEALVSGAVTPQPIAELKQIAPQIFQQLCQYAKQLETHRGDMQDIEFTFENNRLWILQTRSGKRTAYATFRIVYDRVMAGEGTIKESLLAIDPKTIDALLYSQLKENHGLQKIGHGLPASAGAAIGHITVDVDRVTPDSLLVRNETAAEDVPAMLIARGVMTLRGGMTSHAAVIMRAVGKPCISGLENAKITPQGLFLGENFLPSGTMLTMDGAKGEVFMGQGEIETPHFSTETEKVLSWADDVRTMGVYANADTVEDIHRALAWGADGIGLCRSEHMMLSPDRLRLIQQFILAPQDDWRQEALDQLEKLHQQDLLDLILAVQGKRLIVRLLDPPLHEFMPTGLDEKKHLSQQWGCSVAELDEWIKNRHESNPMMGQRGCRLGLAFPQLYTMQMRALFQAMDQSMDQSIGNGQHKASCGVLIPLVADIKELQTVRHLYESLKPGSRDLLFGVMIETPRAALLADSLAPCVDFISFGTNDLTQMTWGLSRDDGAPIIRNYQSIGMCDPFATLDIQGVGQLISWACTRAKTANPHIKISVCGEHAGCIESIPFFHQNGVHSVSCSPWALPRIRLGAAQLALLDVEA